MLKVQWKIDKGFISMSATFPGMRSWEEKDIQGKSWAMNEKVILYKKQE